MRGDDIIALTIYVKFRLGDVVYVKTATQKYSGMVIGLNVRPTGVFYVVTWEGAESSEHYDIELTKEFIPDYDTDTVDD